MYPRIMQELKDIYKRQESEGKLPSRQQLATYYATFRNKFGPDKLASLDGEALLEKMHSHGTKEDTISFFGSSAIVILLANPLKEV